MRFSHSKIHNCHLALPIVLVLLGFLSCSKQKPASPKAAPPVQSHTQAEAEDDPFDSLKKGMPQDIADLIDRKEACTHWGSEFSADPERKKEIEQGAKESGCDHLIKDEEILREKYKRDSKILEVLNSLDQQ